MLYNYSDVLTIADVCEILMIGRNRARELLVTGELAGFRLGRMWKIPKIAMEEYLKRQAKYPEKK